MKGNISERSDIFSFVALFYYLLTGDYPWSINLGNHDITSPNFAIDLLTARNKKLTYSPSVNIDDKIKRCIIKSTLHEPTTRFSSIEEFMQSVKGNQQIDF